MDDSFLLLLPERQRGGTFAPLGIVVLSISDDFWEVAVTEEYPSSKLVKLEALNGTKFSPSSRHVENLIVLVNIMGWGGCG